ncbi:MAG: hypothetical protein ACE145_18250 [Terriglobia bacterium]
MLRKIFRYLSLASLILGVIMVWLVLRKPVIPPIETSAEAARSFNEKLNQLTQAKEQGAPGEIRLTAAEINSEIQEGLKAHPPPAGPAVLKNAVVQLEGDRMTAFLTATVKGVELHLTVGGNLRFENHTVRLVPTDVHVGSLPVPVSWLEDKLDMHLEVPPAITAIRVENSELVVQAQ